MLMKKKIFLCLSCLLVLVVLFVAYFIFRDTGNKVERVSQFSKLIFHKGEMVPNRSFSWNMGIDDFLSEVYGADTMKPDSESFNQYSYSYNEKFNSTSFTPPITYIVKGIPGEATSMYNFNDTGLYQSGYAWVYNDGSQNEKIVMVEKAIEVLAEDINSNPNMIADKLEMPDLTKMDDTLFPYKFRWSHAVNSDWYIELHVGKLRDSFNVAVSIGIEDVRP